MRRRFTLFGLSGAIAGCGALIGLGDYVVDGESTRDGSIGVDGASPLGDAVVPSDAPVVVVPPGCGNGQLDPGEGCDDHNVLPYGGCSPFCQRELLCNGAGCQAICGDGFRVAGSPATMATRSTAMAAARSARSRSVSNARKSKSRARPRSSYRSFIGMTNFNRSLSKCTKL